ncbi:hypothetical protein [Devosia sp. 63-57]|uniref:hypothetical protein n=1 Tax=Devosia sp. 63-57 TaxID=1895751 RepID=UPI00086B77EC|nr:hypothetical protein [Devosia sp. 63-57]ODT47069.1 MAG: hypothetical protein ABS74_12190 [Pelagibacterium sp. SCN 63-126]ODU88884.1 MAG: hypothetical protein ABT14_01060 [Pelagibacterium sp. SCN 63-17]OJX43221.1 MAG: hypothetical protein BGO80_17685 [Devosia sp. 63-57]
MKLEPRVCLWSGLLFRPSHPGQLFYCKSAALAFERSKLTAIVLSPEAKATIAWQLNQNSYAEQAA